MTGQQAQRRPLKYYLVQILVVPSPPNINHVLKRKSQREKKTKKKWGTEMKVWVFFAIIHIIILWYRKFADNTTTNPKRRQFLWWRTKLKQQK